MSVPVLSFGLVPVTGNGFPSRPGGSACTTQQLLDGSMQAAATDGAVTLQVGVALSVTNRSARTR
ncbi:MAG TPA: hypothetical protein VMB79_14565 [Jatrophihabitans sp.]|nr:hypothetical protein [Jatrophihabitans sp.]